MVKTRFSIALDASLILFYARPVWNRPMTFASKTEQRDLFRGALEMMVLRSVLREPMHGYALVQHIKQRSNELLQVEEGSLYPALQRLLREGLLTAEWEISASNRKVRTDYGGGEETSGPGDVEFRTHAGRDFSGSFAE